MGAEEPEVMPAAIKHLTADDWVQLDAAHRPPRSATRDPRPATR